MIARELLKKISRMVIGFAFVASAHATVTDIADAPLITSASSSIKPNLMFIMDDSGSMDWDFLPDWANDNFCRRTDGAFTGPCCRDNSSTNGAGSGTNSCFRGAAPFGSWRGHPPFLSSDFNSVAYSPAITYTPPLNADGTSKTSQTTWTAVKNDAYNIQNTSSIDLTTQYPDTAWCTNSDYTDCLRNDNYILPGTVNGKSYTVFRATTATGTGSVASGSPAGPTTAARSFGPHFYTMIAGEFCNAPNLRNCQPTETATYKYPAKLRWCSDTALSNCQAVRTESYQYPRYPTMFSSGGSPASPGSPAVPASVTFTINVSCSGDRKVAVGSVNVDAANIIGGATSPTTTSRNTLAGNIRSRINNDGSGFVASGTNNSITITATNAMGDLRAAVSVDTLSFSGSSGACTVTVAPTTPRFSGYAAAVAPTPAVPATYYGSFVRTDIVPGVTSYPYPGTATKAATRSDCAGATCSYSEEMTNFANWWTYYRTRMQMTKSSASIAFGQIDSRYRVGYFTINNSTSSSHALDVGNFDSTQKAAWYARLVAANPSGGTPLRGALTRAGRIYAGAVSGTTGGGDPVQYSCQQNFTILSTDGYWSESNPGGYQVNGSTAVGNQDDTLPRPLLDGTNTSNTLADVAAYYYKSDLRTSALANCTGSPVPPATAGNNVCNNNVPSSGQDAAAHQHMTTFTVGLGISGYMQFSPSYLTATTGDFFDVKGGTIANPAGGVCSWQASGTTCNWPVPSSNSQANIDDLWHAAVNGFGTYFSASDPASLSTGLSNALAGVSARTGNSAAATTSNPNVATGDNFVFSSTFTSVEWSGELIRQQMDLTTGAVSNTKDWEAQALLNANTSRTIHTYSPGATNRLKPFNWDSLTVGAERDYFNTPHISTLSQFCTTGVTCLSAASQTDASGAKLVSFLRGERTNEGVATDVNKYYRQRAHLLGDIVNSEAVYVKSPLYNYADGGYADFKSGNGGRQSMVYASANDGMLHAFNASTGQEAWAFIPSLVLPNLYKLADKNYGSLHRYFVDGTPTQADVQDGTSWRTILVAGLNGGGRGYYALDITDPAAPKALWEFTSDTSKGAGYITNANLGYTYGKPEITKLKDGTWVVLVTSGYNNVSPGDGKGYLYVLNATTGAIIRTISTGAGSTDTVTGICATAPCPSGLAQIRAWADSSMTNNTGLRVYGGDLFGNLWRFDINGDVGAAGYDAQLMATLRGAGGNIQPITARPELGDVAGYPIVYLGTGRYMGLSDLTDTSSQTLYAIKDRLDSTSYGSPRSNGTFVAQTLTDTTCPSGTPVTICTSGQSVRTGSNNTVNFATHNGWYIDLPDSSERSTTDPQLVAGTITFTTNVVEAASGACTIGGYSHFYFLDYRSGAPVSTSTTMVVSKKLSNALATRPVVAKLPNNKVIGIIRLSDGTTVTTDVPLSQSGDAKRVSWRELVE
jgi:type IV pilus assembly protein PilY1